MIVARASSLGFRIARIGLLLSLASLGAFAAEPRRVLLIHSFGQDFSPFNHFSGTLRTEMASRSPEPIDIYQISLESARHEGDSGDAPFADYIRALFAKRRPDLLVSIGGPAARFAQGHRHDLFPETPLLMASVDQRHLATVPHTLNDTAVAVRNAPRRVVENILQILPETRTVAVVIGNSPLEQFWRDEIARDLEPLRDRVELVWLHDSSFEQVLERCATLPAHTAIFYAIFYVDAEGVPYTEQFALDRIRARANAPLFGLHSTQLGAGMVGGPLIDIQGLARTTADVAVRLLHGESPGDVETAVMEPGIPEYDWRELRRWDISEAALPAGSRVYFRAPTFWVQYRGRIVVTAAVLFIEAALIAVLVVNLIRRRRAEGQLRESEERLSLATATADIGVCVWAVAGDQVWASRLWRDIMGLAPDTSLRLADVLDHIHPDDRDTVASHIEETATDMGDYVGEFRVVRADGTERTVAVRCRTLAPRHGIRARLLGVLVDITERRESEKAAREFGGRLIAAQETERARLGRELHDDISQRLARLAIDVGSIERKGLAGECGKIMGDVREGLVRLSDDVHSMAYQLHPAVLDDLGLAEALKAESERFSRHESIPAQVQLQGLPARIPAAAALCLFRVSQEALRNVARHARATSVEVSVKSWDGGLWLAVTDTGAGFDPTVQFHRPSLGLRSMRERVHALGGELDIESAPGHGTTISAWVPLKQGEP